MLPPGSILSKYMRNVYTKNIDKSNTHPGIIKLIFLTNVLLYLQGDEKMLKFWVFGSSLSMI